MSILTSVRARRFADRERQPLESLIAFRLRQEWCALPLTAVWKVISLDGISDGSIDPPSRYPRYQDQEIIVIDVGHRFFEESPKGTASIDAPYLALLAGNRERLLGLPIDSPPSLRRVPRSAFLPLAATTTESEKRYRLSSTLIPLVDHPPLALLDLQPLLAEP